jgi:hypothetical protein
LSSNPGRYYRISPRFWQERDVRNEWTEDMRMLALYLLTAPHRNMVGLYYCPTYYMAADLQWTSERLQSAFDRLLASRFVLYDKTAEVVFVRNALKYDSPTAGNQVVGAIAALSIVPSTPLLLNLIESAERYCPPLAARLKTDFADALESLKASVGGLEVTSESLGKSVGSTVSVSVSVSEKHMCDSDEPHDTDKAAKDETQDPYPTEFESFWQAYPTTRRIGKQAAFKNWKTRLRDNLATGERITADMLATAASNYAAECKRVGREAQYIKHPQGFLGKSHYFADYLQTVATPREEVEHHLPADWASRARRRDSQHRPQ